MSTSALERALYYFEKRDRMDRPARLEAAEELGGFDVFSGRQIALILDVPHTLVASLISKKDKRGGRFRPEALKPLLTVAQQWDRGEVSNAHIAEAVDAGVSTWLTARLTGMKRTTVLRRYEKAKEGK